MNARETITQAGEALTVRRVFGDPYERDGVTIIPAAAIRGGGGGGEGEEPGGQRRGSGGGFGLSQRPVGAFVIRGGEVRWQPAVDATRIVLLGQVVAAVALLALRSVLKARSRPGRRRPRLR